MYSLDEGYFVQMMHIIYLQSAALLHLIVKGEKFSTYESNVSG